MQMEMESVCPCGSQNDYSKCCEPLIRGGRSATTPEELIRSRYTAFTINDMDYIFKTHHPKSREDLDMEASRKWAKSASWEGLELLPLEAAPAENKAQIEFKVKYQINGKRFIHHELSEFRKDKGVWYFYDGQQQDQETYVREAAKVGRNDPCICGSGKKYKKCCG